jgi:hypothetical protein
MPPQPESASETSGACAQCGASLRAGARFCKGCGAAVEKKEPRADASGSTGLCPQCGHAAPAGIKFCQHCGSQLADRRPTQSNLSGPAEAPGWRKWAPAIAVVAALLVAGGVAALLLSGVGGAESESDPGATSGAVEAAAGEGGESAESNSEPADAAPAPSPQVSRAAILSVLDGYEAAYSEADLAGMAKLFAPDVERHGLSAGGCSTVAGKSTVLAAYQSQFVENGPLHYELTGLGPGSIDFDESRKAHVETEYAIASPPSSGAIDFTLEERGGAWRITAIDATCNPS